MTSFLSTFILEEFWGAANWVRYEITRVVAPATAGFSFDCDSNPKKVEKIAENLLADWKMAEQLVTSYGGRFVGLLEPNVIFSKTRHEFIRYDPSPGRAV